MKMEIQVRRGFIAVFLSMLMCSMGFALHLIPQASTLPVINGVASIGEWDNATWIDANTTYGGPGALKRDANEVFVRWTAMWSSSTNQIYAVVKVMDMNPIFATGWQGIPGQQDFVAICVDANDANTPVDESGKNTHMQAWVLGFNAGGSGFWQNRGIGGVVAPSAGDIPAVAATVNGSLLTYEIALKPFSYYDDVNGVKRVKTLATGNRIGLDVVVGSKTPNTFWYVSDSNGAVGGVGKISVASKLLQHTLATTGCSSYNSMDYNKDCVVKFEDVAQFAANWLHDSTTFVQNTYKNVGFPFFTAPTGAIGYAAGNGVGTQFSGWYCWPRWWSPNPDNTITVEFTSNDFLGNGIRFMANCFSNGGPGRIYIDGVPVGDVNTWCPTANNYIPLYVDYTGVTPGKHIARWQPLAFTDPCRTITNFTRFESLNPSPRQFSGKWFGYNNVITGDGYIASGDVNAPPNGAQVWFTFNGTGITWYGQSYFNSGHANIWIDANSFDPNVATANVDQYQPGKADATLWSWTKTGLAPGTHTIKIRSDPYNQTTGSTGKWINWTRFEPIQ